MNGPRRRLLVAAGSLLAGLAGCLGANSDGRVSGGVAESEPDDATTELTRTTESTRTTEPISDYPATVNATTTVEREEIEYVEENDTVRYVAAYGNPDETEGEDGSAPEREPIYETIPFGEWAEVECASVGSDRVWDAMVERLDGETEGISVSITREDGEPAILVGHQTRLNRDGDVISEPNVSYKHVKRVAPESAEVVLTLDGRTRSCVVPVTTREAEIREQ